MHQIHPLDYPIARYVHDLCLKEAEATDEIVLIDDGPWEQLMSTVMFHYWDQIL